MGERRDDQYSYVSDPNQDGAPAIVFASPASLDDAGLQRRSRGLLLSCSVPCSRWPSSELPDRLNAMVYHRQWNVAGHNFDRGYC